MGVGAVAAPAGCWRVDAREPPGQPRDALPEIRAVGGWEVLGGPGHHLVTNQYCGISIF